MKMRIEFDTDNAAFVDGFYDELQYVLGQILDYDQYNFFTQGGYLKDSNGNTVGQWIHEEV